MLAAPLLAEEASGIGALGIDPQAMFVYLLNFAVLAVILYFFAYKKILGVLDARSNRIRESLEEADRVRVQAQEQTEQMQRTLDEGRQAGQLAGRIGGLQQAAFKPGGISRHRKQRQPGIARGARLAGQDDDPLRRVAV